MRSMTGFAKVTEETPLGRLSVEIHSVNRKFLDLNFSMPKELTRFDPAIRKWIGEEIERGAVTLRLFFTQEEMAAPFFISKLKESKKRWEKCAKSLGYKQEVIDFAFLIKESENLPSEAEEKIIEKKEFKALLQQTIKKGVSTLIKMKKEEGDHLKKDLKLRLELLKKFLAKVEKQAPSLLESYKEKLQKRLGELTSLQDDRLIKEIAFFAEKCDISEEISRLTSHLSQFLKVIDSSEKSVGKTLEFLVQEMHREISTMSAKVQSIQLTQEILLMKAEVEKIKEQVPNIE